MDSLSTANTEAGHPSRSLAPTERGVEILGDRLGLNDDENCEWEDGDEATPLLPAYSMHLRNERAQSPESGLRRIPTIPCRAGHSYFQGHGSEKVVVSDEIADVNCKVLGVPKISETFATSVIFTLGYTIYLLTAWLKCAVDWSEIFPNCHNVSGEFLRTTCEVSCLAFWTAPIASCILVVAYFYSDLLCIELYYALLGHNVLIDYDHAPFMKSYPVLMLLCWQILGLGIYVFDRHFFFRRFIRTLPYWFPVISAFSMLWFTWGVKERLISLSKYVERNFEDALHHLGSCVFVRDFIVKAGAQSLQSKGGFRQDAGIGATIRDIVQEIEVLQFNEMLHELKPEPHDSHVWMTGIIYDPPHQDERSRSFRFWFRIYRVYTLAMFLLLFGLMNSTRWRDQRHRGYLDDQPDGNLSKRWLAFEDAIGRMLGGDPLAVVHRGF